MNKGGRPIGDVRTVAEHYKVSKNFIFGIGFNRFMASTELARKIYIADYLRRKGLGLSENFRKHYKNINNPQFAQWESE